MNKNTIPKISIIVPVYNAGEYFIKCMDTLVNQTLREVEIILVLDCPTDGTDIIAKKYAENDKRIVIIENKTNLHIGNSRNEGIKIARGEYIGFSDHDDYRELTMYEELYSKAKANDIELVLSKLENDDDFDKYQSLFGDEIYKKEFIIRDLIGFGYKKFDGNIFVRVVNGIYKRSLLETNRIQFIDTNNMSPEDAIFQIECVNKATKISFLPKILYHHVEHQSNEGNTNSYLGYEKRGEGINYIYRYLNKEQIFETYKNDFYTGVTKQFIQILSSIIYPKIHCAKFIKAVKHLRAYPFCKTTFSHYALPTTSNKFPNKIFRKFLIFMLK